MSEFSPQTTAEPPPTYTAPSDPKPHWLKKPILFGQSIPWLTLYAAIIIGAAVYLFAPAPKSNVNRLAFGSQDLQPATQAGSFSLGTVDASDMRQSSGSMTQVAPGADLSQMQDQVAAMVAGVRTHSETNRQAIEQVAASLKTVIDNQNIFKNQVQELQTQNAELQAKMTLLSVRQGSSLARHPTRAVSGQAVKPEPTASSSPLAGMQLRGVQKGMAWVYWQDKTWAVQIGDLLGPVTITDIDAQSRQVRTSAGTLQ